VDSNGDRFFPRGRDELDASGLHPQGLGRTGPPATHGLGEPLDVEGLTFRIVTTRLQDGRTAPSVECEGVIVEMSPR
jgi:hypothetical protein